jgi:hypothetical protein
MLGNVICVGLTSRSSRLNNCLLAVYEIVSGFFNPAIKPVKPNQTIITRSGLTRGSILGIVPPILHPLAFSPQPFPLIGLTLAVVFYSIWL